MVLPFVRELLADLKPSEPYDRVRRHLESGQGRRRIAGLTFTARALYLPFFVQAVPSSRPRSSWSPTIKPPRRSTRPSSPPASSPARSNLPRSSACLRMTCCRLRISRHTPKSRRPAPPLSGRSLPALLAWSSRRSNPPASKLFHSDFYSALALTLKVGEEYLPDMLIEHLLSVGYTKVDVVEMPGQLTLRGGIIDVYSPEMDRPVRIDFFGDQIESIRKFDPETQRSQSSLDTALLLPLSPEIPITERVLEAINARLTRSGTAAGAILEGGETPAELQTHVAARTGEATVFPGWGVLRRPVARSHANPCSTCSADTPASSSKSLP